MPLSPTSQAPLQRGAKPRPVKLRNACNQCCASKVKCSGDRTGCERCQTLGTSCVYLESRVGKVQGVRSKKRRVQNEEVPQSTATSPDTQPGLASALTVIESPTANLLEQNEQTQTWQWSSATSPIQSSSTSIDFIESRMGSTTDITGSSEPMMPPSTTDDFMSGLAFDMDDLWNPPLDRPSPIAMQPPTQLASAPDPSRSLAAPGTGEVDGQCVAQCYFTRRRTKCERAAHYAHASTTRLTQFTLLDAVQRHFLPDRRIAQALPRSHSAVQQPQWNRSGSASFQWTGDDENDQSSYQAQRILKEINQVAELAQTMRHLAGIGPDQTITGTMAHDRARQDCFVDLEVRLRDLATCVKKQI